MEMKTQENQYRMIGEVSKFIGKMINFVKKAPFVTTFAVVLTVFIFNAIMGNNINVVGVQIINNFNIDKEKAVNNGLLNNLGNNDLTERTFDNNVNIESKDTFYAGWGDSLGGRQGYTMDQVANSVLEDKVVFNSIIDGQYHDRLGTVHRLGDERNFVRARLSETNNMWNADEIIVEDGKVYTINMYVHNDNFKEYDSIGYNTRVSFSVPGNISNTICVNGFIMCKNAIPNECWDGVVLKSPNNEKFHLEFISQSGSWESNGKSAGHLSDDIIKVDGVHVGYDELDGRFIGGYQYSGYAGIEVKVVFEK